MMKETANIVEAESLQTPEQLYFVLDQAKRTYTDFGTCPPPIPENAASFLPCTLRITEPTKIPARHEARKGRIQFLRENGEVHFDVEWEIAPPFSRK